MTRAATGPRAVSKHPGWDPRKVLRANRREVTAAERLVPKLTPRQRSQLQTVVKKLDRAFVTEKAELIRDTLIEIQRHRNETSNPLLQRSVWSSLDCIALELDRAGFTRVFKEFAPKLFGAIALDSPEFVSLEWRMFLDFLGTDEAGAAELGMPLSEIHEVFHYAEEQKGGPCGLAWIRQPEFSFRASFARFCGRPDQILEIHHSPQAKATVAIIAGAVNLVAIFWTVVISILTAIVITVVGCAGC